MAAMRRLALMLQFATLELKLYNFVRALERHYAPDQPRVPAGNPDGGQWTGGEGGLGLKPSRVSTIFRVAGSISDFKDACKVLRLDPKKASDVLHAVKRREHLGGADNCTFDSGTGNIIFDGEVIGNLRERP